MTAMGDGFREHETLGFVYAYQTGFVIGKEGETMENKVIITVVGKDTVGIIARICTYLADNGVNVLDITQTIVKGFFNMMMIVDINASKRIGKARGRNRRSGKGTEGRDFRKDAPLIGEKSW